MYSYFEAVVDDVKDYIRDNIDFADYEDIDELEEELNDELWTEDSVTGNGSGSYTFNRAQAKEYVLDNTDDIRDMADTFGTSAADIGEHFMNEDWEWFDVSLRCYHLGSAIREALEDFEDEFEAAHEEDEDEE